MNLLFKIIIIITLILVWAVIFYFLYLTFSPIDNRYGIKDLLENNTALKQNFVNKMPGLANANEALGIVCNKIFIPGIPCPYIPKPFWSDCQSNCKKDYGEEWHEVGKTGIGCSIGQERSICSKY